MRILRSKLLPCLGCEKEVMVKPYRFSTFKYCSKQCKDKYGNVQQIEANCAICDKPFTHISSRVNKAKYCSTKCYHQSQIGKGNTKFNCLHCGIEFLDSASVNRKYCSRSCINKCAKKSFDAKYSTVRKMMITRDLIKKCSRCGYDKNLKILGVHHKDRNRDNNNLDNLEVLCPNCHSEEHLKHIVH